MKKLLAVILAIVMMFSMTSVSFANEASTVVEPENTIDNYVDYLEAKLNDAETNIFVKMLVKIVLVFIHFGFIKPEDFQDWFENTAPEDKEENTTDNTTNKPDTSDEWEDGTELELYYPQSLPYTERGVTFTDIKVTKERCNELIGYIVYTYKYTVTIKGSSTYSEQACADFSVHLEDADYYSNSLNPLCYFDKNGDFVFTDTLFSRDDADRFALADFWVMAGYAP